MQLKINGNQETVEAKTLAGLVKERKINCAQVVIEHNLEIVDKDQLANVALKENDVIEILSFIGGG